MIRFLLKNFLIFFLNNMIKWCTNMVKKKVTRKKTSNKNLMCCQYCKFCSDFVHLFSKYHFNIGPFLFLMNLWIKKYSKISLLFEFFHVRVSSCTQRIFSPYTPKTVLRWQFLSSHCTNKNTFLGYEAKWKRIFEIKFCFTDLEYIFL